MAAKVNKRGERHEAILPHPAFQHPLWQFYSVARPAALLILPCRTSDSAYSLARFAIGPIITLTADFIQPELPKLLLRQQRIYLIFAFGLQ